MTITSDAGSITLLREPTDLRMKSDSQMLYHLRNQLRINSRLHWIKVRMAKDGHLVDDLQQYVCTPDRRWMIYQTDYAIRDLYHDFNRGLAVTLGVVGDVGQTIKTIVSSG